RRARRARRAGRLPFGPGADRREGYSALDAHAALVERARGRRGRTDHRARREARVPVLRGLHDAAAGAALGANGSGTDSRRPDSARRRRRPAPGIQHRPAELRARPDDDAPRLRARLPARPRRPDDDLGRHSVADRQFALNNTLGFLSARAAGRTVTATFKLARPARVAVRIETPGGGLVRTLASRNLPAGDGSITWTGRPGAYLFSATATNDVGAVELTSPFRLRR